MFDFKKLKINKSTIGDPLFSSFVGIRKSSEGGVEFNLPRGFDDFPDSDFYSVKNIFFKMYKTFKIFEKNRNQNISDLKPSAKDNIEKQNNAYSFKDAEDNDVILYSKITLIDNMLEVYKDLALDTMDVYTGRNEEVDYSKIENYLDKAIYLDNDFIFIDEMDLDSRVLNYKRNDLVGMFCFIFKELQVEMENEVEARVIELSNQFSEHFLSPDQRLFDEYYFQSTISTLKDVLYAIDKDTAYKDEQYWILFEAIERFLYGELDMDSTQENGIFWGISNFYQIWEDMCNSYMIKKHARESLQEIFYADTTVLIDGSKFSNKCFDGFNVFLKKNQVNPFFLDFRGTKRYMRPDMVIIKSIKSSAERAREFFKVSIIDEYSQSFDIEISPKYKENESNVNHFDKFSMRLKRSNKGGYCKESSRKKLVFRNYSKVVFDRVCSDFFIKEPDFYVIDWKYVDKFFFYSNSRKLNMDITKQICYEKCLIKADSFLYVRSQFGIPWYFKEDERHPFEALQDDKIFNRICENKIEGRSQG